MCCSRGDGSGWDFFIHPLSPLLFPLHLVWSSERYVLVLHSFKTKTPLNDFPNFKFVKKGGKEVYCYINFTYSHLISKPSYSCGISTSHFPPQPLGFLQREDNGQVKWERWFTRLFPFALIYRKIVLVWKDKLKPHITEGFVMMGEKWIKGIYFILVIPNTSDDNSSLVSRIWVKMPCFLKPERIFAFISDGTSLRFFCKC